MKIYIAGKISGLDPEEALLKFSKKQRQLEQEGNIVINPLQFTSPEMSWQKCMKRVIPQLCDCDAIYMLSNWGDSRGARLERFLAERLGIKILYEVQPRWIASGEQTLTGEFKQS